MLAADLVRARVPTLVFGQSRNSGRGHAPLPARRRSRGRRSTASTRDHGATAAATCREQRREIERRLRDGRDPRASWRPTRSSSGSTSASSTRSSARATRARSRRCGSASAARAGAASESIVRARDVERAARPVPRARARRSCSARRSRRRASTRTTSEILVQHLKCAAFELPVPARRGVRLARAPSETGEALGVPRAPPACSTSRAARSTGRPTPTPPTTSRSGASAGTTSSSSTSSTTGRSPSSTGARAHTMLHEQAIYQHDGEMLAGRALRPREPQGVRAQGRRPTTTPTR